VRYFAAILAITALPALFAQAPAAPPPADPNKVVLTIGTEKLTAADYDAVVSSLPQQYQAMARGPGKRAFAEQLIQLKILAAQAEKQKLDQSPEVQKQIAFQKQDLLARVMFQSIQDNVKVDDTVVQQFYDAHKNEYEVVKARHILIRVKGAASPVTPGKPELTDEEAKAKAEEVRKRIVGGEDFATVAKAESDDKGSAAMGGDLPEFKRGMMVPQFEQAAFSAKVGDVGEPVKSSFGYHIIQVQSHTTKPLAEVKADIEGKLKPDLARKAVEAMRAGTQVTMDDAFFGPATPPAQPVLRPVPR
jgi:peptidyl-prolyl cis-trans isomerase C